MRTETCSQGRCHDTETCSQGRSDNVAGYSSRGGRRRAALVPAVVAVGLALLLAGCGSGQITQTDTQVSGVDGASGTLGPMAIRSAELAFPPDPKGVYQPGSSAELIVTIVNTGLQADTLTGISTPAAQSVTIDGSPAGSKPIPGGFAIRSGVDVDDTDTTAGATPTTTPPTTTPPTTTAPTTTTGATGATTAPTTTAAPALAPSAVRITLVGIKAVNGAPLRAGLTIPVTFTFAHAGQITLAVPLAAPPDNASYPDTAGASG